MYAHMRMIWITGSVKESPGYFGETLVWRCIAVDGRNRGPLGLGGPGKPLQTKA